MRDPYELDEVVINVVMSKDEEGNEIQRVRYGDEVTARKVYEHFKGAPAIKVTVELDTSTYCSSYGAFDLITDQGQAYLVIRDGGISLPSVLEEDYNGETCKVTFEEVEPDVG